MNTIFKSRKSKSKILLYKVRIVLIPTLVILFLLGITDSFNLIFWLRTIPLILSTWGLLLFLRVFYTFRYYIKEIQITENQIEIIYFRYGREKNILLSKDEIYFRLNDFRRKSKYFEVVKGDKLIIKQAPYLEWVENMQIKKLLEDHGFRFRTYW